MPTPEEDAPGNVWMSEEKQEWLRSAGVDVEAAQEAAARARDLALASSAAKRELKFIFAAITLAVVAEVSVDAIAATAAVVGVDAAVAGGEVGADVAVAAATEAATDAAVEAGTDAAVQSATDTAVQAATESAVTTSEEAATDAATDAALRQMLDRQRARLRWLRLREEHLEVLMSEEDLDHIASQGWLKEVVDALKPRAVHDDTARRALHLLYRLHVEVNP